MPTRKQPITSRPMTDEERRMYDDLKWGEQEVYVRRPDLVDRYEKTGGVVAVFQRRIVAHGVDLDAIAEDLEKQGLDLSHAVIVNIVSFNWP